MKKVLRAIPIVLIFLLCCTACGRNAQKISCTDIGEAFESAAVSGRLSYTVNSVRISDNILGLGIEPSEIESYDGVSYTVNGELVHYSWPDYVDLTTGQLTDDLLFVLVDLTVTNIDALGKPIPEDDDGSRDDSWYCFPVGRLSICDTNESGKDAWRNYQAIWYDGTDSFDGAAMGTNGDDYFVLWPGEALTYQLGFIVGRDDGDYSGMCLTDGGGSYYAKGANYVRLEMSSFDRKGTS